MNTEPKLEKLDQKVWLVNGVENILNFYISRTSLLKKSVDCCYEYYGPIHIKEAPLIWENNLKLDKRGIKVRFLTEIRNENLQYCKKNT
jgi:two-component system, OmpR family, sensor histidine kinase VicK